MTSLGGEEREQASASREIEQEVASARPWLRAALACDALDVLDLRSQCLHPAIKPLHPGAHVVGHVKTLLISPDARPQGDNSYEGLLAALEAVEPGDVFVSTSVGVSSDAVWGELMANACLSQGAVGAVCDGYARDYAALEDLPFSIFARGTIPYDSKGRSTVISSNIPVDVGGVAVSPGDLLVGDDDGVVIVPRSHVADVIRIARAKLETEDAFRREVREGLSLGQAVAKYNIL